MDEFAQPRELGGIVGIRRKTNPAKQVAVLAERVAMVRIEAKGFGFSRSLRGSTRVSTRSNNSR